jgi:hypothetical protein
VVAEPLGLTAAVAAPPLGLVGGQVRDRQDRGLEQPTPYGDAGTAGGAGQRGGIQQVLRALRAGQPDRDEKAEAFAAYVEQALRARVVGKSSQVAVALDQDAELDQDAQRRGERAAVDDRVEVDGEAGVGHRAAHLGDELVEQQLPGAAGECGQGQAEQRVGARVEGPAAAAAGLLAERPARVAAKPALNSRATLGSTTRR